MDSPKIFICYRRDDSAAYARSVHAHLRAHFGAHAVFMDLMIQPGDMFVERIERAIASCAVLLVVIGREWLSITDDHGGPRLDDPEDLLQLEIKMALERPEVVVIPLLVNDARMPKEDQLPAPLARLARYTALAIRDDRWDDDIAQLVEALRRRLQPAPIAELPPTTGPADPPEVPGPPGNGRRLGRLKNRMGRVAADLPLVARLGVPLLVAFALVTVFIAPGHSEPPKVRIGAIYSLTGKNAEAGKEALNGVRFAIDYINSDRYPDLGLRLHPGAGLPGLGGAKLDEPVVEDAKSDRCNAEPAFNRLVTRNGVAAVIGAYESTITLQAIFAANRQHIPFVNDSSTAASLTAHDDGKAASRKNPCSETKEMRKDPTPSPWFSRVGPNDGSFADLFESFIKYQRSQHVRVRRVAILYENNDIYGESGASDTKDLANRLGIEADLYPYNSKSIDSSAPSDRCSQPLVDKLRKKVKAIKGTHPDAVFALSYLADAVATVQAMREVDYTPPALLAYGGGYVDPTFIKRAKDGNPDCELPGANPRGIITRAAGWSQTKGTVAERAAELFEEKYDQPMTDTAARAFTAMLALAQAIDDAGSTEAKPIQNALRALDFSAAETIMPGEGIHFDRDGQNIAAGGILLQILSGTYKVVYPNDQKTANAMWPLPPGSFAK
jgi:branched-chain amino acid transport system substrate-binding protein